MTERPSDKENVLEILQSEILSTAETYISLQDQAGKAEQQLFNLLGIYQKERYQQQETIWRGKGLTRCTECYNVPPNQEPNSYDKRIPAHWGGWGLMPFDDAHYVLLSGSHWHRSHESDSHHEHLYFHRLCTQCYEKTLKENAASKSGSMRDLTTEEVEKINQILEEKETSHSALSTIFGRATDIEVDWHKLPIPEEAYEIGQNIVAKDLLEKLRRAKIG